MAFVGPAGAGLAQAKAVMWKPVCAGALLALGACAKPTTLATIWPAEEGDLVFVLQSLSNGETELVTTVSGHPTFRFEPSADDDTFAVVVPEQTLRSLHYAVDPSSEGLGHAELLESDPTACSPRVVVAERSVSVDFPMDAQVYRLSLEEEAFVPSTASATALLGGRILQLKLRDEPCRVRQEPSRFSVPGSMLLPSDGATFFRSLYRHEDTVFALTGCCLYAYTRSQPPRSLMFTSFLDSGMEGLAVKGMVLDPAEGLLLLVAFSAVPPTYAGGSALIRISGSKLEVIVQKTFGERINDFAIAPDGQVVAACSRSQLLVGSLTSSVTEQFHVSRLRSLDAVAVSDRGEFVVASAFAVGRGRVSNPNGLAITSLYERGLQIDAEVVNMAFVQDNVVVATLRDGLYSVPQGLAAIEPLALGVAVPQSACGPVTQVECLGVDRFDSSRAMRIIRGSRTQVVTSNQDCPVLASYEIETGCTTEIPIQGGGAQLAVSDDWLTISSGLELYEIPTNAFGSLPD